MTCLPEPHQVRLFESYEYFKERQGNPQEKHETTDKEIPKKNMNQINYFIKFTFIIAVPHTFYGPVVLLVLFDKMARIKFGVTDFQQ